MFVSAQLPQQLAPRSPRSRRSCAAPAACPDAKIEGAWRRFILDFRASDAILNFVNGAELARYSQAGVVTPDHTIRTKNWPLIVPAPEAGKLDGFPRRCARSRRRLRRALSTPISRATTPASAAKTACSIRCRASCWCRGLACSASAAATKDARIAADLAEAAVEAITDAEAIGRFESISEADMFDWNTGRWNRPSSASAEKPLAGQVAVITGAGGAIGAATARAFAAAGAEVALLDRRSSRPRSRRRKAIGGAALAVHATSPTPPRCATAFDEVVAAFGGVDILVSNAGAAWQGRIGEVDEAMLRQSFELNFFAHQSVAQAAVRIMRAQGTGGCLLFNVSKQAVNPGPNFGPYGLPKAATLFLVRQYALDYGADGIRANAVNADRIRSGLLTDDFIAERAKARGVSEKDYMGGNLLGREVTAEDVAQAFLHQALALKTTGDVTTVTAAISRRRCGRVSFVIPGRAPARTGKCRRLLMTDSGLRCCARAPE